MFGDKWGLALRDAPDSDAGVGGLGGLCGFKVAAQRGFTPGRKHADGFFRTLSDAGGVRDD